jgi:broad-specificity NMP kinase
MTDEYYKIATPERKEEACIDILKRLEKVGYYDTKVDKELNLFCQVLITWGMSWTEAIMFDIEDSPNEETIKKIVELYKQWLTQQPDTDYATYIKNNIKTNNNEN